MKGKDNAAIAAWLNENQDNLFVDAAEAEALHCRADQIEYYLWARGMGIIR